MKHCFAYDRQYLCHFSPRRYRRPTRRIGGSSRLVICISYRSFLFACDAGGFLVIQATKDAPLIFIDLLFSSFSILYLVKSGSLYHSSINFANRL